MNDTIMFTRMLPDIRFKTLPVRIIIPVSLTFVLFVLTIFRVVIPMVEQQMMDGRRETLRHLTQTAWSTLSHYHDQARAGLLTDAQARQAARSHFQALRYGPEGQDYFWINDMGPVMIMHPYRPDLEGRDVSGFTDPAGRRLFADMVTLVRDHREGFVDYLWQWQGDPDHIVPKISHVRGFEPWGWVIGTGLYVADVRAGISAITRQMTWACAGIMILILLLSGVIIREASREKQQHINAQEETRLREQQLVQADKMASLGILVAGVAHEINNPVTALMLNAPSLKKAWDGVTPVLDHHYAADPAARICNLPYPDLQARVTRMLDGIADNSARIKRIITELKDFSRPGTTCPDQSVDVNLVMEKALDLTLAVTRKATAHLAVDLSPGLPRVAGDPYKLQQVVINLLVNAAQALESRDQGIWVHTTGSADRVVIQVQNDGPGVDPDTLKKFKDPFYTTRRDSGGTGLGLSICDKIIAEHGGTLDLESFPGRGVTVRVSLPAWKDS